MWTLFVDKDRPDVVRWGKVKTASNYKHSAEVWYWCIGIGIGVRPCSIVVKRNGLVEWSIKLFDMLYVIV